MGLILYNNNDGQNITCSYALSLYAACPENLRPSIEQAVIGACANPQLTKHEWTLDPELPRLPWTINQLLLIMQDPWFAWGNDCNISPLFLEDIFGIDNFNLDSKLINPIVNTSGFSNEKLDLIKAIGGLHHYFHARTYYIDRCYGTDKYIEIYHNNSKSEFYDSHTNDIGDYMDSTGMIVGSKLLEAWQDDPSFRQNINTLSFIKPLTGILCEDFWNWSGANIYWWSEPSNWSGSWTDNLAIADSWYGGNGNTVDINESKLITPLNEDPFPGFRVSVNDIYSTITSPESDTLAALFGNNLLKGPSAIEDMPTPYEEESCSLCYNCTENNTDNCYSMLGPEVEYDPTGCTGIQKQYPPCAGKVYIGISTGDRPDRLIVRNGEDILLDTGFVVHGTSDWRTNPAGLVFGEYYFCKPEGVTSVDIEVIIGPEGGSWMLKVGNCLIEECDN